MSSRWKSPFEGIKHPFCSNTEPLNINFAVLHNVHIMQKWLQASVIFLERIPSIDKN